LNLFKDQYFLKFFIFLILILIRSILYYLIGPFPSNNLNEGITIYFSILFYQEPLTIHLGLKNIGRLIVLT